MPPYEELIIRQSSIKISHGKYGRGEEEFLSVLSKHRFCPPLCFAWIQISRSSRLLTFCCAAARLHAHGETITEVPGTGWGGARRRWLVFAPGIHWAALLWHPGANHWSLRKDGGLPVSLCYQGWASGHGPGEHSRFRFMGRVEGGTRGTEGPIFNLLRSLFNGNGLTLIIQRVVLLYAALAWGLVGVGHLTAVRPPSWAFVHPACGDHSFHSSLWME